MWNSFIDFLFPKERLVQEIEKLKPYEFALKVRPAPKIKEIHALFAYQDILVEKALWELKYQGNRKMADLFGTLLYEAIISLLADEALFATKSKPIIISIPPSKLRMRNRGFDQNNILLKALDKIDSEKQFEYNYQALRRNKDTVQQSHTKNKNERWRNMDHLFSCNTPELFKNKTIVVIDDVTTTGSTLLDAKRALEDSGASQIYLLAIAH